MRNLFLLERQGLCGGCRDLHSEVACGLFSRAPKPTEHEGCSAEQDFGNHQDQMEHAVSTIGPAFDFLVEQVHRSRMSCATGLCGAGVSIRDAIELMFDS